MISKGKKRVSELLNAAGKGRLRQSSHGKAARAAAALFAAILVFSPVLAAEKNTDTETSEASGTGSSAEMSVESSASAGTTAEAAAELKTGAGASEEYRATENDSVSVHLAGEPGDPVPFKAMDTDTASLLKLVSEGLTTLDANGNPVPGSARKWRVSEEGLKWTFTLRDDLRWADGEEMTAEDFAALFQRIADPAWEALYGSDLTRNIAGYEEVLNGDSEALEVSADGDRKVVVRLQEPDPDFAKKCASWALLPIREQIRDDSPDDVTADWEKITGNGPYYIDSVTPGQEYILKKNPYYRGTGAENTEDGTKTADSGTGDEKSGGMDSASGTSVPYEEVRWMTSGDSNEEYSDFLNGDLDAMTAIPAEEETKLAQLPSASAPEEDAETPENAETGAEEDRAAQADPETEEADGAEKAVPAAGAETQTEQSVGAVQSFLNKEAEQTDSAAQAAAETETEQAESVAQSSSGTDAVSDGEKPEAEAAASYREQIIPDTMGILFNCRGEALSDPLVRRALAAVIDRAFITSEILDNVYVPADTSSLTAFSAETETGGRSDEEETEEEPASEEETAEQEDREEDSAPAETDFEYARELLAEAGMEDGEGMPALTCIADENGGAHLVADYLASVWGDLGIEVHVETLDAEDLAQEKAAGTFDIICGSLFLTSDLPDVELGRFASESEENVTGFASDEYDEKMEKTAQDLSGREYAENLQDALEILGEEKPFVPLAERRISWLRQESADGIFCDTTGCWQLWKIAGDGEQQEGVSERILASGTEETENTDSVPAEQPRRSSKTGEQRNASLPAFFRNKAKTFTQTLVDAGTFLFAGNRAAKNDTAAGEKGKAGEEGRETSLDILRSSTSYFEKTDTRAWLTSQAWVLESPDPEGERLVSLPKYEEVHLVGTGNPQYARIARNGKLSYVEADKVTADPAVLVGTRELEQKRTRQRKVVLTSLHPAKESELSIRAADVRAGTDKILKAIARREMLRTQTRNPNWNGPVLSRRNGSVRGPSGKETYYNLNMNGVVNIMRRMGNTDEYWVRDDGCKMLGDYIMCAANLRVHPRGSLVESSLGTCIVCDTGGFASHNSNQLDIAVTW